MALPQARDKIAKAQDFSDRDGMNPQGWTGRTGPGKTKAKPLANVEGLFSSNFDAEVI
jgi:hypothetical protein